MYTFHETSYFEPGDTPISLIRAEQSPQAAALQGRLAALRGRIHPSYGQMAWLDDAFEKASTLGNIAGELTIAPQILDERNDLIKGVR